MAITTKKITKNKETAFMYVIPMGEGGIHAATIVGEDSSAVAALCLTNTKVPDNKGEGVQLCFKNKETLQKLINMLIGLYEEI